MNAAASWPTSTAIRASRRAKDGRAARCRPANIRAGVAVVVAAPQTPHQEPSQRKKKIVGWWHSSQRTTAQPGEERGCVPLEYSGQLDLDNAAVKGVRSQVRRCAKKRAHDHRERPWARSRRPAPQGAGPQKDNPYYGARGACGEADGKENHPLRAWRGQTSSARILDAQTPLSRAPDRTEGTLSSAAAMVRDGTPDDASRHGGR